MRSASRPTGIALFRVRQAHTTIVSVRRDLQPKCPLLSLDPDIVHLIQPGPDHPASPSHKSRIQTSWWRQYFRRDNSRHASVEMLAHSIITILILGGGGLIEGISPALAWRWVTLIPRIRSI
jgi:hypothetical protein